MIKKKYETLEQGKDSKCNNLRETLVTPAKEIISGKEERNEMKLLT